MKKILRSLAAVVIGFLVGATVVALVESIGHFVFPPPPGVDITDPEQLEKIMQTIPLGALLFVLAAYALGTIAGSAAGMRLANRARRAHGWIVGALLLAAGVATMLMIPHPAWFWLGTIVAFPVGSWLGTTLVSSLTRAPRQQD